MAGLAINAAVRDKPAKEKLEFFGNSFFIPIFFIVTEFLVDPVVFFQSITANFPLTSAIIGALLVGKWIAAQTVGRAFAYSPVARLTMWSLTLLQVAATLAATLVAFDTRNPAGQRLIDGRLLNVVLVLLQVSQRFSFIQLNCRETILVQKPRPTDLSPAVDQLLL